MSNFKPGQLVCIQLSDNRTGIRWIHAYTKSPTNEIHEWIQLACGSAGIYLQPYDGSNFSQNVTNLLHEVLIDERIVYVHQDAIQEWDSVV